MHEKKFGQKLRNWKIFSLDWSSIDRIPIELSRFYQKIVITISIGREIASIDRKSGKLKFLKNRAILCRTPQSTIFHEWNAWVWD